MNNIIKVPVLYKKEYLNRKEEKFFDLFFSKPQSFEIPDYNKNEVSFITDYKSLLIDKKIYNHSETYARNNSLHKNLLYDSSLIKYDNSYYTSLSKMDSYNNIVNVDYRKLKMSLLKQNYEDFLEFIYDIDFSKVKKEDSLSRRKYISNNFESEFYNLSNKIQNNYLFVEDKLFVKTFMPFYKISHLYQSDIEFIVDSKNKDMILNPDLNFGVNVNFKNRGSVDRNLLKLYYKTDLNDLNIYDEEDCDFLLKLKICYLISIELEYVGYLSSGNFFDLSDDTIYLCSEIRKIIQEFVEIPNKIDYFLIKKNTINLLEEYNFEQLLSKYEILFDRKDFNNKISYYHICNFFNYDLSKNFKVFRNELFEQVKNRNIQFLKI